MKKLFVLTTLSMAVSSALAQTPSIHTSVYNHSSINNRVETSAATTGIGSSYSHATGAASASATAHAVVTPVTTNPMGAPGTGANISVSGTSSTSNSGTTFNVSTGNGVGSASSRGRADANANAIASFSLPGQVVTLNGTTTSTGSHGTNINLSSVTNQGLSGSAQTQGSFSGNGSVGSSVIFNPTGTQDKFVWGHVEDSKSSSSQTVINNMVVDGVVLTPGVGSATASTAVNVNGYMEDPR